MTEDQQFIENSYKNLPADLQQLIYSIVQENKLASLVNKYSLNQEDFDKTKEEIFLVLLGIEHKMNFELNLRSALELNRDSAFSLASDIQQNIFLPYKQSIKELKVLQNEPLDNASDSATQNTKIPAQQKSIGATIRKNSIHGKERIADILKNNSE